MPLEPLHPSAPYGTPSFSPPSPDPGLSFSFPKLLRFCLQRWYLFVLAGALGLLASWAYLRYTPRQYEVNTLVRVRPPDRSQSSPEGTLLQDITSGAATSDLDSELRIILSRETFRQVVDRLNLDVQFFLDGLVLNTDLYRRRPLNPFRLAAHAPNKAAFGKDFTWQRRDDSSFYWRYEEQEAVFPFDRPFTSPWGLFLVRPDSLAVDRNKEVSVRFRRVKAAAGDLRQRTSASLVRNTDLIRFSLRDPVPVRAADVLRELLVVYDQESTEYQNQRNKALIQLVDERIRRLSDELDSVGRQVEDFVLENDLIAGPETELQSQLEQLKEIERLQASQESQLDQLLLLEEYILRPASQTDTLTLIPFRTGIQNLDLSAMLEAYNQLLLERNRLAEAATPENPGLIGLNARAEELKVSMLRGILDIRNQLEAKKRQAEARERAILTEIQSLPSRERGLVNIERQKKIKEDLYLFLLQRREETALTSVTNGSNVRVIEPPSAGQPVGPSPLQAYLLGLMGGLFLPLAGITLELFLDRRLQSVTEVRRNSGLPYLGTIGYAGREGPLVVKEKSRSLLAEQFRMLRTNLHFQASGGPDRILLVTSAVSGEGKSFVSLNLAMTLAIGGKSVCLLGFDLRKPQLNQYFGIEDAVDRPGLSHYLVGDCDLDEILLPSPDHPNLFFVPSGPLPPNPAELILSRYSQQLFESLRELFDHVVLDTPPLGLVTDAVLLGRYADLTLFIARFRHTTRDQLELAREFQEEKKLPHMGLVFNGLKSKTALGRRYSAYNRSGAYYTGT